MSNYLERLVNTVSRPVHGVHPRTGSLYAPQSPGPDTAAESVGATEPEVVSRVQAPRMGEPVHSSLRFNPVMEPFVSRPMNPVPHAAVPKGVPSEAAATRNTAQMEAVTPHPLLTTGAPFTSSAEESQIPKTYVPLLEAQQESPSAPLFISQAGDQKQSRVAAAAQGRVAQAERERDEIQIHIGRIEVTAVQPSAPRASQAPERGPSLDAYLERRRAR